MQTLEECLHLKSSSSGKYFSHTQKFSIDSVFSDLIDYSVSCYNTDYIIITKLRNLLLYSSFTVRTLKMAIPFILPELLQPKIVQLALVILNNLTEIDYNQ